MFHYALCMFVCAEYRTTFKVTSKGQGGGEKSPGGLECRLLMDGMCCAYISSGGSLWGVDGGLLGRHRYIHRESSTPPEAPEPGPTKTTSTGFNTSIISPNNEDIGELGSTSWTLSCYSAVSLPASPQDANPSVLIRTGTRAVLTTSD